MKCKVGHNFIDGNLQQVCYVTCACSMNLKKSEEERCAREVTLEEKTSFKRELFCVRLSMFKSAIIIFDKGIHPGMCVSSLSFLNILKYTNGEWRIMPYKEHLFLNVVPS